MRTRAIAISFVAVFTSLSAAARTVVRRPEPAGMQSGLLGETRIGAQIALQDGPGHYHGLVTEMDGGWQFGFGLAVVAHGSLTQLFGEDTEGYYCKVQAGLRYVIALSRLRLWAQATYGAAMYLVAPYDVEDTDAYAGYSLGQGLSAIGGLDFQVMDFGERKGWLGLSGGVDINPSALEGELDRPLRLMLTLAVRP